MAKTKAKPPAIDLTKPVLFDPLNGIYPISKRHPALKDHKSGLSATSLYFFALRNSSATNPKRNPLHITLYNTDYIEPPFRGNPTAVRAVVADLLHRAKQAHGLCLPCLRAMQAATPSLQSEPLGSKTRNLRAYRESTSLSGYGPLQLGAADPDVTSMHWLERCGHHIVHLGLRQGAQKLSTRDGSGSAWYCHVCAANFGGPLNDDGYAYRTIHGISTDVYPSLRYATPYMTTHLLRLTGVFIPPKVSNLHMDAVGRACRKSSKVQGIYHPISPDEVPDKTLATADV